uniref:Integrin subunit beta 3 binding protein n=1 Tax=Sphenodon punctatus TaxID=8508 RepID=A0A8D0HA46_SPHPU
MPVKRALKLENIAKRNSPEATPQKTKKECLRSYSPTTGTRQISPLPSPTSHNVRGLRNALSNGDCNEQNDVPIKRSRRGQCQTREDNKLLVPTSKAERDPLERFIQTRQNLTSLQALEGNRELENILGVLDSSCNLKAEVQKTKMLMAEVAKLKLLQKSDARPPAQEHVQPVKSYEFLKSIME